jgi:signal transduction histidine kinase
MHGAAGRALVGRIARAVKRTDLPDHISHRASPSEGWARCAAAVDLAAGLVGARIALADTVAGAALRSHPTQRLEDELNRARFDQHGLGRLGLSATAGLVVPLVFHNQAHGALIAVDRLHDGPAFTAEDQALLEAFATSAATAVAAARTVASEVQRQRLAAAEGERGRWARELHDETLQILAALRVSLSQAHRVGDLQILTEAVGQAIEDIEEGISTLRSLVTELRPVALDELSLEAAVESLCERASRHGSRSTARSTWHTSGREPTRHTAELETAMYRIIQEALTNAAKHGHAKRAAIGNP